LLLHIQFKTVGSLSTVSSIPIYILRTRSHFRKDNHPLSSESQKTVISTPDIGYSFSINPPWTRENSPYHYKMLIHKNIIINLTKHWNVFSSKYKKKSFTSKLFMETYSLKGFTVFFTITILSESWILKRVMRLLK